MYSGYGTAFDRAGSRTFVIFVIDDSSSSHTREGPTDDINGRISAAEKRFRPNFCEVKTKPCLSVHYNDGINYLFVIGKNVKFKTDDKNVNFPY